MLDPTASGQPLAGVDRLWSAAQVGTRLTEMGLCHEFRYEYRLSGHQPNEGYSEKWCVPPPGAFNHAGYLSDGTIIVFVMGPTQAMRPQPNAGWGC
jgi:hypothetical protein